MPKKRVAAPKKARPAAKPRAATKLHEGGGRRRASGGTGADASGAIDRPLTPNHEKLLDAALELISERGVAGASLRALAQTLGMRQPSLYHYFKSKDDLVLQLVQQFARKMLAAVPVQSLPENPCLLPHDVASGILALWSGDSHPRYARFVFAIAIEVPEHRASIQRVFHDLYAQGALFGARYALTPAQAQTLFCTLRMLAAALGMTLLEERVLFGVNGPSAAAVEFAQWMARACQTQLEREGLSAAASQPQGAAEAARAHKRPPKSVVVRP